MTTSMLFAVGNSKIICPHHGQRINFCGRFFRQPLMLLRCIQWRGNTSEYQQIF